MCNSQGRILGEGAIKYIGGHICNGTAWVLHGLALAEEVTLTLGALGICLFFSFGFSHDSQSSAFLLAKRGGHLLEKKGMPV